MQKTRDENARRRERHAGKSRLAPQLTLARAREARFNGDWGNHIPPQPQHSGVQTLTDIDLEDIRPYIDWMPFFNAWQFHGKYPDILADATVGEAARSLFNDATQMLDRLIQERWLTANAVFGLFPANSVDDDDIRVYTNDDRKQELLRFFHLRQQRSKPEGQPQYCLADFVAPEQSSVADYIGAFAVTAGVGIDEHVQRFEDAHDDYSSILLKALADRLAEASAEYLHARVRQDFWGYDPGEALTNDQLIAEAYRGIRPAPGYPACPDHTEKQQLWRLLNVEAEIGLRLTESCAMFPTAAVSGFYFSHPEARYFSVGKLGRDQVESYAARKGMSLAEAERWLAPNLGYDPSAADAA